MAAPTFAEWAGRGWLSGKVKYLPREIPMKKWGKNAPFINAKNPCPEKSTNKKSPYPTHKQTSDCTCDGRTGNICMRGGVQVGGDTPYIRDKKYPRTTDAFDEITPWRGKNSFILVYDSFALSPGQAKEMSGCRICYPYPFPVNHRFIPSLS